MIRKHITLKEELDERINKFCKDNSFIYSHAIRVLIENGLNNYDLMKKLDINNSLMEKIFSRQIYIRDLLEQLYTDMEIENHLNPNKNKALQQLKKERYKGNIDD